MAVQRSKKKAKKHDPDAEAKKVKKQKIKKEKKEHYVNAKVFFEQIKTYYETDVLPDGLAESLHKIAVGLGYATNFINYSYKDEMIGDAVLKMWSALKNHKFNVETGNSPFSYFTTIAYHAFINRIKKEKKYRETITKYQEEVYHDAITEDSKGKVYIESGNPSGDDE